MQQQQLHAQVLVATTSFVPFTPNHIYRQHIYNHSLPQTTHSLPTTVMGLHCHPVTTHFSSKFHLKVRALGPLLVLFPIVCREFPTHALAGTPVKKQRQGWGGREAASHEILGYTMGSSGDAVAFRDAQ